MLSNLYFLSNYNNYYNREIKRKSTLTEYLEDRDANQLYSIYNYNFEMNDGVVSEVIINFPMGSVVVDFRDHYLIVEEQFPNEPFLSRWFVVETKKIREGQYQIGLRRDLVADFLEPLLAATVYVEKGRITQDTQNIQTMNPLVFNQETFAANQIKKKETLLKDKLGCKWIVGYLNKGAIKEDTTITTYRDATAVPDYTLGTVQSWITMFATKKRYITSLYVNFDAVIPGALYPDKSYNVSNTSCTFTTTSTPRGQITFPVEAAGRLVNYPLSDEVYSNLEAYAKTKYGAVSGMDWITAKDLANKVIIDENTLKVYRVVMTTTSAITETLAVSPTNDPSWYNPLSLYITSHGGTINTDPNNFRVVIEASGELQLSLVEIEQSGFNTTIKATHNTTLDEAFDAFAIPYMDDKALAFHFENVKKGESFDNIAGLAIATELMDYNNAALDLQLLPYCPLPENLIAPTYLGPDWPTPYKSDYMITITKDEVGIEASPIYDVAGNIVNGIFWLTSTQFSKIISYVDTNDYSTVENIKAINQLDTWRIESGDYSSSFEFNMARNGGVQYFEIDCKYKPYQPYIHIAPNFGGLYGADYNDTRGLVCSNTNYSLPRISDTWENYERNNLNYMNSFNRQIQNMDINRKYQRGAEIASLIAGAGSGAASGAITGSIIPGVKTAVGGAIGAAIGTATSLGAGIADAVISENLYKENKQYAIDQFNMSLQNIQALPNTMVAAGALNPNNKVFPVLSYYSCSNIEREAFLQKLKWNGMTVGVITDNIADYIGSDKTYFKGSLVYMDTETTDIGTHEIAELANELAKGIIFDKGVIE